MNTQISFAEYQKATAKTAVYPGQGTPLGLIYCALKLTGESGEVSENVGKAIRDDTLLDVVDGQIIADFLLSRRREKLEKELGDVMWYLAQLCTELGLDMNEVALTNIAKLADRKARGVLHGSGDDR